MHEIKPSFSDHVHWEANDWCNWRVCQVWIACWLIPTHHQSRSTELKWKMEKEDNSLITQKKREIWKMISCLLQLEWEEKNNIKIMSKTFMMTKLERVHLKEKSKFGFCLCDVSGRNRKYLGISLYSNR